MVDLSSRPAKRCLTVCGFLIRDKKILLVLHKKLGIWLAPGGHVEANELPHLAAERELWEETGIKVKAMSALPRLNGTVSEYLPVPFVMNLHWIMQGGCEQHYTLVYLMKLIKQMKLKQSVQETDGIEWFTLNQVRKLNTTEDIKQEIKLAFGKWEKIDEADC